MLLYRVADEDVTCILSLHSHVYHCADAVTFTVINAYVLHQPVIAHSYLHIIHISKDALSADLLDYAQPAAVYILTVCPLYALADGVGGGAFGNGSVFYEPAVLHSAVMYAVHIEHALCEGAGLVEYYGLHL